MAFLANQIHQVSDADDAAAGNHVQVVPAPGAGVHDVHGGLVSEERDWANLLKDAVVEIGEKLLAMDATEYIRMRAVCKPWKSSTADRPTWETCLFPRNWAMLREDEDHDHEVPADPAAPRRRRFVNLRTGATLGIQLPSFDEYGDFYLANAEGLLIFYCDRTETVRLFNPLTTATAVLPGFSGEPGLEGEPELAAAGIVVDRRNTPGGQASVVPNVVLVVVSRFWPAGRQSTVILCAKPGDHHWGTVDAAGVVQQVDSGGHSLHGRFYIPTHHGDVLRLQLHPQPHLVYVARPPGRAHCRCGAHDVVSHLAPSLDDANGTGENDATMLLVRVFADDQVYVQRVHLGNGSYTQLPQQSNRTIFLRPGLTLLTDRFPSLVEQEEEGCVHVNEHIEDYIGNNDV